MKGEQPAIPNSNGIKNDTEFAKTIMNELNVLAFPENEPFFLAFSHDIQLERLECRTIYSEI